jgi:hypothetical protein
MTKTGSPARRRWADLVAIVAAVVSLANAMWGPLIFSTMQRSQPQGDPGVGYNWSAFGIGGLLALLGVFLAERRTTLARVALVLAGLMLIAVPFAYRDRDLLPIAVSVALGLLMIGVSPFIGPMPPPRHPVATPGGPRH